ncbi:ArsA family ATPase [Corynebacterium sp.]|uniref:ArsA family ATPase n=1 Tax=Corynebacterium sp. TaxID=1720 RepID=UPI0027BB1163|nr:ArsA family ATPase [Corynebacterium sp.]
MLLEQIKALADGGGLTRSGARAGGTARGSNRARAQANGANQPRIVFFGGKGGVGKSTIASAVALGLAEDGYRVQLVSTDPAHNLGHMWEQSVGARGVAATASKNLHLLELDPAATTEAHIAQVEDTMRRMMPERLHGEVAKHLDLARNSPGTHEAAMVEAIAQVVEDSTHDFLIFDTAPSGHTSRLLAMPELMNAWTQGLMNRRDKSERFSELIRGMDPKHTAEDAVDRRNQELRSILHKRQQRFARLRDALQNQAVFYLVLTAEKVPVMETAELHAELAKTGIDVGGAVVNRRSPADQGRFLANRRRLEDAALDDLHRRLPDVAVTEVPLLDSEVGTPAALAEIATHLRQK